MSARFVSTTRLSNVIQMISLARQSGILRALRGQGVTREVGQIRFIDGQPVAVLLGQLTGQAALGVLMNWAECVYTFDEGPQIEGVEGDPSWSFGGTGSASGSLPFPEFPIGSWPSYGYGSSPSAGSSPPAPPSFYPSGPSATSPLSPPYASSFPPTGTPPAMPTAPAGSGAPAGGAGADNRAHDPRFAPPAPTIATAPELQAMTPEMLRSVPARTAISAQVDQLPLDRRERMVLLLVDGQRTVAELTRLIRRSQHEVYAVLYHLRLLGLIEFRR